MCILQQNFDFTKTKPKKKKAHFLSNSLAQIWLEIWHYLTLRNSPQWKNIHRKCVSTHVNTLKMHNAHLCQQSNSWWRMLWLRNDLLHESNLIPQNFLESRSEGDAKRPVSFWLSVQTESHLKPLALIQCNLKWIQLNSVTFNHSLSAAVINHRHILWICQ